MIVKEYALIERQPSSTPAWRGAALRHVSAGVHKKCVYLATASDTHVRLTQRLLPRAYEHELCPRHVQQ